MERRFNFQVVFPIVRQLIELLINRRHQKNDDQVETFRKPKTKNPNAETRKKRQEIHNAPRKPRKKLFS